MEFILQPLPPKADLETPPILKQLAKSHRYLAELKGTSKTIPNENILIDTLTLQEAKDSSEIENIVTTHDDLYKENILIESKSLAAKEVYSYARGLRMGFQTVRREKLLLNKHILQIHKELLGNEAGFRKQAGTKLVDGGGRVVYTPPQAPKQVMELMANLEKFINDPDFSELDILVKMAVAHYQFESIHPFYDGNGRTGRILNILFLVQQGLLDIPVLYLSRYITQNKPGYYQALQETRTKDDWEQMVLYLLKGVEVTAQQTIGLIAEIKTLMQDYKERLRKELPKVYSQDLLNTLFKNPYTKIDFLENELRITRQTASRYLKDIAKMGLLEKKKIRNTYYFMNHALIDCLSGES